MSTPLPSQVTVTELPQGVHYRLPLRPLGHWRWVGMALMLVGAVLCAAPALPVSKVAMGEDAAWLLALLPALLAVKGGIVLGQVGLLILAGHSEIRLDAGILRATECCGPVRRRRERSIVGLRRLFVSEAVPQLTVFTSAALGAVGKLCLITPEWKPVLGVRQTRPMRLALGYPRAWLMALAEDLARRCVPAVMDSVELTQITADPAIAVRVTYDAAPPIPVLQKAPDLSEYEELDERPIGSKIAIDASPERATVIVPPDGMGPHQAWFSMGTILCLIALVMGTSIITGTGRPVAVSAVFALGCSVIGVIVVLTGFARARRYVLLEVAGDRLIVWQSGLMRVRRRQWARQQVADVFVVHYPGTNEGSPYWALLIQPHHGAGEACTLLAHRDVAELRWLATVLRRQLGCPGHPSASPPTGLVVRSGRP